MLIQQISVTKLVPAPYNPRVKLKPGSRAWAKLERSLTEFELVQPIVWNERTGHVVSGHQRLEILKHKGADAVDCVVVDLPLEKEKALNVTLNNKEVGSDWDAARLVDLVVELQDLPDFDATLTGFDDQQLRDLVFRPAPEADLKSESEADSDLVQLTLEIPRDDWEAARHSLDRFLADHPSVRLHGGH